MRGTPTPAEPPPAARSGCAPGPQGDQLLVLAAGTGGRPEPGHPGAKPRDLAIGDRAEEPAVAQFLDATPEGAITALRTTMEGDVDPEEVIASEHVTHEGSGTANLPGVLAEAIGGLAEGGAVARLEAQSTPH